MGDHDGVERRLGQQARTGCGSTGRPKGVELTHANLANLVCWHVSAFDVIVADRASQVATTGFDAAVWDVLQPVEDAGVF